MKINRKSYKFQSSFCRNADPVFPCGPSFTTENSNFHKKIVVQNCHRTPDHRFNSQLLLPFTITITVQFQRKINEKNHSLLKNFILKQTKTTCVHFGIRIMIERFHFISENLATKKKIKIEKNVEFKLEKPINEWMRKCVI